jgi:hypothetical protein
MHGGTATTDRRDAPTMAGLLRGGRLPQADASPAARRATRARRRRQMPLLRPRAEWCAPGHQTTSQDTRPARGSRPMTTGAPMIHPVAVLIDRDLGTHLGGSNSEAPERIEDLTPALLRVHS